MGGNSDEKGRICQLRCQMAQRRMMQEVLNADVVITNPTPRGRGAEIRPGDGPVVIAKGYDEVTQKLKAIDTIPMVENVSLARALARDVETGHPIAAKWLTPVAEILAAVYRLRKGAA